MKDKLDYSYIKKKLLDEITAIKGETRAEIILLQAHVEFMIDEILEILIETDSMRGTKSRLGLKLQILNENNWITNDFVFDISILSTIRGWVSHRIDIYDDRTQNDIESEFKKITLLSKADSSVFPKGESLQKHLRLIAELYFDLLYYIYEGAYALKSKSSSLKNPTTRDNYHFLKTEDGGLTIQFDEI